MPGQETLQIEINLVKDLEHMTEPCNVKILDSIMGFYQHKNFNNLPCSWQPSTLRACHSQCHLTPGKIN